ncbi:uncharacterized protein [Argopecten irradians]|uniref:uncharacterized protein n=1 Tax=Argopecten irradians TaxID=31199 RepID=UPI00371B7006
MDLRMFLVLCQAVLNFLPQISSKDTLPKKPQFTIFQANATWNEAQEYCKERQGHLLRIDSQAKFDLLTQLDRNPPWNNSLENGEFWIGLHNTEYANCSEVHHFWEDGCQPLGWKRWGGGFPDKCDSDRCVVMTGMHWSTANCSNKYSFVCEKEMDCEYTRDVNVTMQDVTVTQLAYKKVTSQSTCKELCSDMVRGDSHGCSSSRDNDTCLWLFVDKGDKDHRLDDSYTGTEYFFKSCEDAKISTLADELFGNNSAELPETQCASVINDDYYYEYLSDYRAAIIPSLYITLDLVGDIEKCKEVCLQTKMNGKQCWAVNMFSVLSNFCRLYYLNGEPPYLFYERYVTTTPGPLVLRRRLSKQQILDDGIVDTIEELEVNPKNTTIYKLKYFSVFENTGSKIGMGAIGSVFTAAAILTVIIADCRTICRHIRQIGARNIRKRTRCRGKKKKNSTKVSPASSSDTGNTSKGTPSIGAPNTNSLTKDVTSGDANDTSGDTETNSLKLKDVV